MHDIIYDNHLIFISFLFRSIILILIHRPHIPTLHSPTSILYSPQPLISSSSSSSTKLSTVSSSTSSPSSSSSSSSSYSSSTDEGYFFRSFINDILSGKHNASLVVDANGMVGKIGASLMRFGAWKWEEDANGK